MLKISKKFEEAASISLAGFGKAIRTKTLRRAFHREMRGGPERNSTLKGVGGNRVESGNATFPKKTKKIALRDCRRASGDAGEER